MVGVGGGDGIPQQWACSGLQAAWREEHHAVTALLMIMPHDGEHSVFESFCVQTMPQLSLSMDLPVGDAKFRLEFSPTESKGF
jgi:hypothetical protein